MRGFVFDLRRLALRFKLEGNHGHGEAPRRGPARGEDPPKAPRVGPTADADTQTTGGYLPPAPPAKVDAPIAASGDVASSSPYGPTARLVPEAMITAAVAAMRREDERGTEVDENEAPAMRTETPDEKPPPPANEETPPETEPTPMEEEEEEEEEEERRLLGRSARGREERSVRRRPRPRRLTRAPRRPNPRHPLPRSSTSLPRALRRRPSIRPSRRPSRFPHTPPSPHPPSPRRPASPSGRCPAWTRRRCGKPSSATPIRSRATSYGTSNAPNAPNPTSRWATDGEESRGR